MPSAPARTSHSDTPLMETRLALPGRRQGKVRDTYDLPANLVTIPVTEPNGPGTPASRAVEPCLLMIATDRISAFDVVMPTPIPGKGRLLTEVSLFWLRMIERAGLCRTHLLATEQQRLAERVFEPAGTTRDQLDGRIMICRKTKVIPIECVVRGYLEGSGWKEYQRTGSVCGVKLPRGLERAGRLPEPIFTPATKEEVGKHDENITFEQACERVGRPLMEELRRISLAIFALADAHARSRGIILADTKFEFGLPLTASGSVPAGPILIDEVLTPDSSRFWPADTYQPGKPQRSFDKQYLREYLEGLVAQGKWNKQAPGPHLPEEIVRATREKYQEARDRLLS